MIKFTFRIPTLEINWNSACATLYIMLPGCIIYNDWCKIGISVHYALMAHEIHANFLEGSLN